MGEGKKYDNGKVLMSALPPHASFKIAEVLTFGAQKYGRDNWRLVDGLETRYLDACFRHLNAHQKGEENDEESGLPHLAHALCCLMFILEDKELTNASS